MFDGGDGVLGVISSIPPPPNTASWVDAKELILVSSDHNTFTQFSSESLADFRRACTCAFLSRGTLGRCRISVFTGVVCYQLFSWWLWSQLPWDHWQILPCSSGWFLTVLMIIETVRGEILHGAPDRGTLTVICVSSPFANNHTNCCHLLTKLLGDGLVAHSSLV